MLFFFSSKGGGLSLILNCSLACPSYQDENSQLKQFKDISLKDEHYHVLVHQHRRQFPRFCFQENHYQFKVMPFGLDIAQRVFTKLMAVSDKYLRPRQIHIYTCTCMYLDDWLMKSQHWLIPLAGLHIHMSIKLFACISLVIISTIIMCTCIY